MAEEESVGCAKPTGRVLGDDSETDEKPNDKAAGGERTMVTARVGAKAPDFVAPAYFKGKFITVKLSEYLKKNWILVCFYPGDFTFV